MELEGVGDIKEPHEDRKEFERRLRKCACFTELYSVEEILSAIIDNDLEKKAKIKSDKDKCESYIEEKLRIYDESDERGKKDVVGQIKRPILT